MIEEYWRTFCKKHGIDVHTPYSAWSFGSNDEEADQLADLVNRKIKTATTSAYELYDKDESVAQVGEYNIILNSSDTPVCVIQTKVVEIIPYNLISAEHAYHEGEGDRSYSYWRKVHDEFFTAAYQQEEKQFYPQAPMVCELFEKIE
ncbi:uncharacterized protein YhfF [Lactobacillus colini]|uniref:Uncharacterized protein YhfF n=2 Tax=Lactobacillus colini TaxID=1819254 RepID=A0ABS4MC57_9LACO|nr:uncharacterized protein YhfF [Lactobacillus colini]